MITKHLLSRFVLSETGCKIGPQNVFFNDNKLESWRLVCEWILRAFDLAQNGWGRRTYLDCLENRAANDGGHLSAALRRGRYLGDEMFRDRLLNLVMNDWKLLGEI